MQDRWPKLAVRRIFHEHNDKDCRCARRCLFFRIDRGAALSFKTVAHDRAHLARRHHRHRVAPARAETDRGERPDRGGGKPRRRLQQYRHRIRRTGAGRRLHHALRDTALRGQPGPVRKTAVQCRTRLRAGFIGGRRALCAGGASVGAGEDDKRTGCAGEGKTRCAQLFDRRIRHQSAHRRGIVRAAGRRQTAAHSI